MPFDPSGISKPAAYLSTHEHVDHCDEKCVLAVTSRGGTFIGPLSSCYLARNWCVPKEQISILDGRNFDGTKFGDVEVLSMPGMDPLAVSSNSYVIRHDNISFFHNGDGQYNESNYLEVASKFSIDVAVINLGKNPKGRKWYHTPRDVARAANNLEPRFLIAHHYDKWDKTLENPNKVRAALESYYPEVLRKTRFIILKCGGRFQITSRN